MQSPPYTKTPNVIYACMPDMGEAELRVTLALIRVTYGYHQQGERVTYERFEELTGMSRQGIATGVADVLKRGFFKRAGRSYFEIVDISQSAKQTETVSEVDQNSQRNRLKQSAKQTETVSEVDQNSQRSRLNHLYKEKERKGKESVKETRAHTPLPNGDPKHFRDFDAIWQEVPPTKEVQELASCIKATVRNPTDVTSILEAAHLADQFGVTPDRIREWFGEGATYWYRVSHGRKDGLPPYAKNILSDLGGALGWARNGSQNANEPAGYEAIREAMREDGLI